MRKKLLALLLVVCMVLPMMPTALATSDEEVSCGLTLSADIANTSDELANMSAVLLDELEAGDIPESVVTAETPDFERITRLDEARTVANLEDAESIPSKGATDYTIAAKALKQYIIAHSTSSSGYSISKTLTNGETLVYARIKYDVANEQLDFGMTVTTSGTSKTTTAILMDYNINTATIDNSRIYGGNDELYVDLAYASINMKTYSASTKLNFTFIAKDGYSSLVSSCKTQLNELFNAATNLAFSAWTTVMTPVKMNLGDLGFVAYATPIYQGETHQHTWNSGTQIKIPTCTENGTVEYTCTSCGATKTETVAALGHSFTHYVYNNDAQVGIDGTETAVCDRDGCHATDTRTAVGTALDESTTNPFRDVKSSDYYYEAVLWAVANNITAGTSATTFSPDKTCTRAQVVTFLWRAAGEPEPTSTANPFTDVKSGAYYYKAVLWAVENGITAGTSKTKFSPEQGCTRAQVATFLYRAAGEPKPTSGTNPFTDVKSSAYYYNAVLWAVENGITAGTSKTKFSPDASCTRAQIVTFLHRTYG